MTHASLFSGIGGFDLAANWVGWDNIFQVEIDPFCQKVLQKNFPHAHRYTDIRAFDGSGYSGKIDIISGGFPCQPFSTAGKRAGRADDRALWPEMLRVIREIQPAWVVGENVAGIINMELDTVLASLESIGYAAQAFVVPACAVNALHRRDRVWIVAHAAGKQRQRSRNTRAGRNEYSDGGTLAYPHADGAGRKKCLIAGKPDGSRFDTGFTASYASDALRQRREIGRFRTKAPNEAGSEKYQPGDFHRRRDQPPIWQPDDTADLLRTAYGLPGRVDRHRNARIKALGNAIVPQVAFEIFTHINTLHYANTI